MSFQPEYSEFLKKELARLDSGNADENKRARVVREKIMAVCNAPENPTYTKNLPENYGAVNVTARYRLFFKTHKEHNIVFFAWINDETAIHSSGDHGDSYQEFRRKLSNGEIEKYQHIVIDEERYTFNGAWGNSYIYIEYSRHYSNNTRLRSSGSLSLTQIKDREYQISSIEVDEEEKGLASDLLSRTFDRADKDGITVTFDLFLKTRNLDKSRHLLQKYDFEIFETDSDYELWIRNPKH
ncbi:MAG: hypothetical protein CL676_02520 [Bdellovibrionaceae bacterium]|nr:hypothetical protein [Pseudobdellovibrionaceae bacterium]